MTGVPGARPAAGGSGPDSLACGYRHGRDASSQPPNREIGVRDTCYALAASYVLNVAFNTLQRVERHIQHLRLRAYRWLASTTLVLNSWGARYLVSVFE